MLVPVLENGAWRYDFYVEGERQRKSTGVRDQEVLEIAIEVARGVHHAAWERALLPYPTFHDAADLYITRFGSHESEFDDLKAHFGPFLQVDEITPMMIDEVIVKLGRPTWTSMNTARRQIVVPANAVINFALGKRPRQWPRSRRDFVFSPEEIERLIDVARRPESAGVQDREGRLLKLIAFLLGSGATPGEAHVVRATDWNVATREIWIRGVERGAGKREYRQRWVHLPARAIDLMGELPSDGLVFLTPTGRPIKTDGAHGSNLIRQFHKLCRAADLPDNNDVVFYSLRHTWATWISAQVGDLGLLIDRGGWSDAEMACHYRKRSPRDLGDRLLAHGWDFWEGFGQSDSLRGIKA